MDGSRRLAFFMPGIPPTATAQQKGAVVSRGRVRFYVKSNVRRAERTLERMLRPHVPAAPFDRPVSLSVAWTFPFRKSERAEVVREGRPVPHDKRPDLDNLEKALLDVMTRLGFWKDDALVADKRTSKWRGPTPGILVEIGGLEP